jgi:hypothetical protein
MSDALDRVVDRTAAKISRALDAMVRDLPDPCASQVAIEFVVRELAITQPFFMQLIMEDRWIREAYAAAVAERPATAR